MNICTTRGRRRDAKRICHPIFSDLDADLRAVKWRFDRDGYARGDSRGRVVRAHRVVLGRMLGRTPLTAEICDHLNHDILDNRRENLRCVTWHQNCQNRRTKAKSGYRGAYFNARAGKWQAYVKFNGKSHFCGMFSNPREAGDAARNKRIALGFHGEELAVVQS